VTGRRGSGLIVPFAAARDLVAPWLDLIPQASRQLPPHVSALQPFVPADALDAALERELEKLLAGYPAFEVALTRVGTFADVVFLAPVPAGPFAELTQLLWREWPECPPFGGAYDEVAPHLPVALDPTPTQRREIEAALTPRLPLAMRADAVLLVEEDAAGVLRERRRFALGAASAP
jgi:hypothetical protein